MLHVKFMKAGEGYIQRREVLSHITVYVKVFHGDRKVHAIRVSIIDKIRTIIDKLKEAEPQEMGCYYDTKLVYPMGRLRNLNEDLDKSFIDLQIPHEAKLVFVGQQSFTWNINAKGSSIHLSNNNLTANKKSEAEYETVLGNVMINKGVHYWEIKIEKFVELDDVIIGVAAKGVDCRQRLFETGKFWGWICTGGRKIYPNVPGGGPIAKEYGGCAKIGDVLGIIFEFKNGTGHLSFLKNGSPLGVCFNNIPVGAYHPCACLYYGEV
jgi:hypothetical protein